MCRNGPAYALTCMTCKADGYHKALSVLLVLGKLKRSQ